MKSNSFLLLLLALLVSSHLFAQPQLEFQPFASGFSNPISIASAGDERMFVVEQRGLIRIINAEGAVLETPFLDLTEKVSQSGNERGLLGLAFHPDFATNGYFFVNYTRRSDGNTVIARFSRDEANPNIGNPESERPLLTIEQPFENHNGGQLLFGPDGYLYIALGDGGSGGDPQDNAQNPMSLLGKMLRVDVDVNEAPWYAIPPDNPFVNDPATRDEIWALGLRNPWRSSFDRLTGDLWIADVGQSVREEINFQPATSPGGENYGWRCYEGSVPFGQRDCPGEEQFSLPVFDYSHEEGDCSGSVTGGYVYRGALHNGMEGHYIFADFCTGAFYYIVQTETGLKREKIDNFSRFQFTAFMEDQFGELYVVFKGEGEVRKVVETGDCKPVAKIVEIDFPIERDADGGVTLEAFYHPTLEYQWHKGDTPLWGETAHTLRVSEEGVFSVTVTNTAKSCSNTSDPMQVSFVPVSISEEEAGDIRIFPNPAANHLRIEGLPEAGRTHISLINANGATVLTRTANNTGSINLSTQALPSGLYVLRVTHDSFNVTKKVVIRGE